MRRHRVALIVTTYVVGITLAVLTVAGASSVPAERNTSWTTSAHPMIVWPQRTDLLSNQALEPIAVYASAVVAWQRSQWMQAIASSESAASTTRAASSGSAPPPTSAGTAAPTSNASIWACIVQHESGGDPTAVNPSSGDGGLYQFNVNTWLSNGGGQYAPNAQSATPAQQTQIAEQTQAADGWSPWVGDGCTPLG